MDYSSSTASMPSTLGLLLPSSILFFLSIIVSSSFLVSAAPTTSPLDPDGQGYTLNFTAFFDYPVDTDTQPSLTVALARTVVLTIEYEVDRPLAVLDDQGNFSHNQITTVGMAIKNSTTDFISDTATAGLDYSKIYKHLTLNVSDSAHSDQVKVTTNENRTATTIWAQFILPIMDWDATEDDIFWATEYFHVITTGLPPGTNFSKINSIRFQTQKMKLLTVYTTPTNRNYDSSKTACENAYPGQNAFLATIMRKDESSSFLSDSGAQTTMDGSNSLKYWLGATIFDDKTKDRNLCWTGAPYYDSEICNTATHPSTARNNTIFTYASSPSSWNTNEVFCSRQTGFECVPSNLGNSWRSLSTGSPSTGTTNSLRTYAAALSYDATNFRWVYGLYDAVSSTTNVGAICVNLTSIGSWGPNYFVPETFKMDALNIVPPNTATVSLSKTKTISDESETASKNISESKSVNTDSFSASFTNETETLSDALTASKTRTVSKIPPPSKTHSVTLTVSETGSEKTVTASRSLNASSSSNSSASNETNSTESEDSSSSVPPATGNSTNNNNTSSNTTSNTSSQVPQTTTTIVSTSSSLPAPTTTSTALPTPAAPKFTAPAVSDPQAAGIAFGAAAIFFTSVFVSVCVLWKRWVKENKDDENNGGGEENVQMVDVSSGGGGGTSALVDL